MFETPPARIEIGNRIKELRVKANLSLHELADEAGFSAGYLSEVERGKSAISGEKLAALARIFGISTDYLLTGENQAQEENPDVQIPQALTAAAVRLDLTLEVTLRLLKSRGALYSRRTKSDVDTDWSEDEWEMFYNNVKDYLNARDNR